MSIEADLETAFKAVIRANETSLAAIPIRLSTKLLKQEQLALAGDSTPQDEPEQIPQPNITLIANSGMEAVPNSGVSEVEFTIEVSDNAEATGRDGDTLDAMFFAATRPLRYFTLSAMLTVAVPGFRCYGMPQRENGGELTTDGSIATRRTTATFICGNV